MAVSICVIPYASSRRLTDSHIWRVSIHNRRISRQVKVITKQIPEQLAFSLSCLDLAADSVGVVLGEFFLRVGLDGLLGFSLDAGTCNTTRVAILRTGRLSL